MFISKSVFDLLAVNHEELVRLRSDNAALVRHNSSIQTTLDWLRTRVNALEMERAQLVQKALGISLPVPEILRNPVVSPVELNADLFEDMGDDKAKALGFPTFTN